MILERIRQAYPNLTRSQKRLADYVTTNYLDAAFMTASRLAQHLGLNEATVIRFAQRLGYEGYPELVAEVQEIVRQELHSQRIQSAEARSNALAASIESQIAQVWRFMSHLSTEMSSDIVAAIRDAARVHVIGQGISASMAQMMALSLRWIGVPAQSPAADALSLSLLMAEISRGELLIGLSSSVSPLVANALRYAASEGVTTIAITCSALSPCAQVASMSLHCGSSTASGLPPLTAMAVTIDAISQAVAANDANSDGATNAMRHAQQRIAAELGR